MKNTYGDGGWSETDVLDENTIEVGCSAEEVDCQEDDGFCTKSGQRHGGIGAKIVDGSEKLMEFVVGRRTRRRWTQGSGAEE